jgi:hypothetical protein
VSGAKLFLGDYELKMLVQAGSPHLGSHTHLYFKSRGIRIRSAKYTESSRSRIPKVNVSLVLVGAAFNVRPYGHNLAYTMCSCFTNYDDYRI